MQIEKGRKVSIHYTLTNPQGEVLDSSEGREALAFTSGAGEIIPGLDDALMGKTAGEHVDVVIEPAQAYGERLEEAMQQVPREQLKDIPDLQEGMPLQAETPQGPVTVFVAEVKEDVVVIDGNHPLAGETLHFSVDIENVEDGEDKGPQIVMPN
ncbi:peptidylprolyl isomerase [Suttonella sp. R2A3]|uniref:FKBP-type peptidyl-prolyl cis-trans isomerase n=1 Tax=Suttonella sp. R2A3 TaxID=2908648 RepID=UPI001F2C70D1|nr:peptidylprolyl isomerase [Suttonella sp. R2A3]UJF24405.1 peptidylprolyl isomerase [Suttonella sp. R2A3]